MTRDPRRDAAQARALLWQLACLTALACAPAVIIAAWRWAV